MTAYELNETEAALIDAIRIGNDGELVGRSLSVAWRTAHPEDWVKPEPEPEPTPKPVYIHEQQKWGKRRRALHLWLMRRGFEFDSVFDNVSYPAHSFIFTINHRFFGVDICLAVVPFKGVNDELDKSHAELADEWDRNYPPVQQAQS